MIKRTNIKMSEDLHLLEKTDEPRRFNIRITSPSPAKAIITFQEDDLVLRLRSGELLHRISYYDILRWMSKRDKSWAFEYRDSIKEKHTITLTGVEPSVLTNAIGEAVGKIMDLYDR